MELRAKPLILISPRSRDRLASSQVVGRAEREDMTVDEKAVVRLLTLPALVSWSLLSFIEEDGVLKSEGAWGACCILEIAASSFRTEKENEQMRDKILRS